MLLTVKVDSEGKFTKCKARQVLSGQKGFVNKPNIHYSIVFASSPGLPATILLQCIGICDNYTRFAFDVRQAFIRALSEPHELFPVAYPKGLERYLQDEVTGKFILDSKWGVHTARKTPYLEGNPGKCPKSRNFAPLDSRALKAP
jgi:hypothetical protein